MFRSLIRPAIFVVVIILATIVIAAIAAGSTDYSPSNQVNDPGSTATPTATASPTATATPIATATASPLPYVVPPETGDDYELSWLYERGVTDIRVYRNQSTQLLRERVIDPATGNVVSDNPASIEQIAAYTDWADLTVRFIKETQAELINGTPVENGLLFLEWLLDSADKAEICIATVESVENDMAQLGTVWGALTTQQQINQIGNTVIPSINAVADCQLKQLKYQQKFNRRLETVLRIIGKEIR